MRMRGVKFIGSFTNACGGTVCARVLKRNLQSDELSAIMSNECTAEHSFVLRRSVHSKIARLGLPSTQQQQQQQHGEKMFDQRRSRFRV